MRIKFRFISKNCFNMRETEMIIAKTPVKLIISPVEYSKIYGIFIVKKIISTNDAALGKK